MSRKFLTPVGVPSHSEFPANASAGDIFFHSVQLVPYIHTGTEWALMGGGGGGGGIIPGGLEGQLLAKASDVSGDVQWIDNYAPDVRIVVKNSTQTAIPIGTPVMAVGAAGDRIAVAPAVADGSVLPRYMLGVTFEEIGAELEGYVALVGDIKGIDTSVWPVGTVLYFDPANPGGWTTVEPEAPNLSVSAAIVTKQSAAGSASGHIFVRMWVQQPGLHELHDVRITAPQDQDVISYSLSEGVWVNTRQPTVGNLDGGKADTNYGGIVSIYGGSAGTF